MIKQANKAAWMAVVVWAAGLGGCAQAAMVTVDRQVAPGVLRPQWSAATTKSQKTTRRKLKPLIQPDRMPSGESVTNRERRLLRECKGRPNAGACLGYAS